MGIYTIQGKQKEFGQATKATSKRYDVGKCCMRFRKPDDLLLDVLGETIASMEMSDFIDVVKKAQSSRKSANPTNFFIKSVYLKITR